MDYNSLMGYGTGVGQTVNPMGSSQFNMNGLNFSGDNSGLSAINSFGMPSATYGANTAGEALGGAAPNPLAGSAAGTLGYNIPTAQLGLGALGSLTNLYSGIKAFGLAQSQFNLQKSLAQTNLNNSVTSYNTNLTDKANARAVTEGQSNADRDAYINSNKLST